MFQDCANSLNAMGHGDPFCILVDLPYQNTSHEDCAQIYLGAEKSVPPTPTEHLD